MYGLLIDYNYCTGCHSCEMACRQEYGFEIKKTGMSVQTIGPTKLGGDKWQYDFLPVPTDRCMLCKPRVDKGKRPTCVQHCQSQCIEYGEIIDLAKKINNKKQVLFPIR